MELVVPLPGKYQSITMLKYAIDVADWITVSTGFSWKLQFFPSILSIFQHSIVVMNWYIKSP